MDKSKLQRCRTCLARNHKLTPLSVLSITSKNTLRISDIFMICAAIQIRPNDGCSQFVCSECVTSAENAYLFKKQCEQSEKVWKQFLKQLKPKTILKPATPTFYDENPVDEYKTSDTGFVEIYNEVDNDPDIKPIEIHDEIKTEKFTCAHCSTIFIDETKHSSCKSCAGNFADLDELATHVSTRHNKTRQDAWPQPCNYCKLSLNSLEEKIMHLKQDHHFSCDECGKAYFRKDHLRLHVRGHSQAARQAPENRFQCKKCPKRLKTLDSLRAHIRRHGGDPKPELSQLSLKLNWPQPCDYCGLPLKSFNEKRRHHDREHGDLKDFKCEQCGKGFFHKYLLKHHLKIHETVKRHMCQYCGTGFKCPSNLSVHIRLHTGEKPYKCDKCDARFTQWSSWNSHRVNHVEEKNFQCNKCLKRFKVASVLNRHMRTHTGYKKYPCHLCPRRHADPSSLKRHLLIHSDARPYECEVCAKGFNSPKNLKLHMMTRTGERPHVCAICRKGFIQVNCLRLHTARYHKRDLAQTIS